MSPQAAEKFLGQTALLSGWAVNTSKGDSAGLPLAVGMKLGAAVEAASTSLMKGLLTNQSGSTAVVRAVTVAAAGIAMTATVLPVPLTSEESSAFQLPPALPLAGKLPFTVLGTVLKVSGQSSNTSLIGMSSVRWSFNPFVAGGASSSAAAKAINPVGDIISLSFTDTSGHAVGVNDLQDPIVLAVPTALTGQSQDDVERQMIDGQVPNCRWWNATLRQWVGDGCRTLRVDNGGSTLTCACTHLTDFGSCTSSGFDKLFLDLQAFGELWLSPLILCAQANALFSAQGLAALQAGGWASQGSAAAFYVLAIVLGIAMILAGLLDFRNAEDLERTWAAMEHVHWFDLSTVLKGMWNWITSPQRWKKDFARSVIDSHVALYLGISHGALDIIEEAQREGPSYKPGLEEAAGRHRFSLRAKIIKASHNIELYRSVVLDSFTFRDLPLHGGVCCGKWTWTLLRRYSSLLFRTFVTVHPLLFPAATDLYTLTSQRTLILTVQLLGSVFCSAFYFYQSGAALSAGTPEECMSDSLESRINRAVPISIVSALVAAGPSQLLYYSVSARPRGAHEPHLRRKDQLITCLFYLSGLGLCAFYLLFVAGFLANVNAPSANWWVLSAFLSLLSTTVLMPLGQAVLWASISVLLLRRDPSLVTVLYERPPPLERASDTAEGLPSHRVIFVKPASASTSGGDGLPGHVAGGSFLDVLPSA